MASKRLALNQNIAAEQRLIPGQSLFDAPVFLVEDTLQKLLHDPAAFESKMDQILSERRSQFSHFHQNNPLFYATLFRAIIDGKSRSPSPIPPNPGIIAESLTQIQPAGLLTQPDVTFEARGFANFTLIPEPHFKPTAPNLFLLQLPKKVVPFAQWMIGQKNWTVKTLGECYFRIGKAQAAFLLDLEPRKLIELPVTSLRDKFELP